jgi:hypothetical protein
LERNLDNVCRGRLNLGDRQHARRDKRAIRAAIVFLSVRAAWHVPGHSGHIAHLANRQRFCRSRHCQRRSNEPSDDKDREQTTDESAKIHNPTITWDSELGKAGLLHMFANRIEDGKRREISCG